MHESIIVVVVVFSSPVIRLDAAIDQLELDHRTCVGRSMGIRRSMKQRLLRA
jgi:hypothetical protein